METRIITTTVLSGQYFLSSFKREDNFNIHLVEKNRLYFLYSEKLDSGKWKVNFSLQRIYQECNTELHGSYGLGHSSSDVISFVVEPESVIRMAHYFTTSVSQTTPQETLFGNIKDKEIKIPYNFDYMVFKEINQDSNIVETHFTQGA